MMNKKYIYQYLLLPLLACLMAGAAGCSSEVVPQEDDNGKQTAGGGTYLMITTRGINTTASVGDAEFEDYVESIRVIGFNTAGKLVCNELHDKSTIEINGTGEKAIATIKQKVEEMGVLHLYFIANEKEYEVRDVSTTAEVYLFSKLTDSNLTEEGLKDIILHYTPSKFIKGESPFLMIGQETALVLKSNLSIGVVGLERTFAKLSVSFAVENPEEQSLEGCAIEELKLTKTKVVPSLFNLIGEKTKLSPTGFYIDNDDAFDMMSYISSAELSENNSSFSVYVPERILDEVQKSNPDNAWTLSIKVRTANERIISGEQVLDNSETETDDVTDESDVKDYNIYRNTCYQVKAILPDKDPLKLILNVAPWDETPDSQTVEWSRNTTFTLSTKATLQEEVDGEGNTVKFYPVSNNSPIEFSFKLDAPVGAEWTASLSDGAEFDFVELEASYGIGGGEAKTFQIKPRVSDGVGKQMELAIRVLFADGNWERLPINTEITSGSTSSSDSKGLILIKQVED